MFSKRSNKKELLDGDKIPEMDLFVNLKELHVINHLLGGYRITFSALSKIVKRGRPFTICDIGSGGGDTLKEIGIWAKQNSYDLKLVGVDLKPVCISYSLSNRPTPEIQFYCDDYTNSYQHVKEIDILHACLFCHHLSNTEIVDLIKFAQKKKSVLVINDLQRNPFAYYAIKLLTKIFSKSYLVKNDAPLSVLRGFKKAEWFNIITESGAKNYSINYKWAFRYEVIIYVD